MRHAVEHVLNKPFATAVTELIPYFHEIQFCKISRTPEVDGGEEGYDHMEMLTFFFCTGRGSRRNYIWRWFPEICGGEDGVGEGGGGGEGRVT